ncbi:MAG: peptidoglycan DD-metalloendopeptidase family protein [Endozoicomonas sp. (ex Botrylloides leachii)]|nr:peptidoglycan DD-metalloendopeptidase family protein [Endozoicomonas sp. (ex Botrylloides leachii)]
MKKILPRGASRKNQVIHPKKPLIKQYLILGAIVLAMIMAAVMLLPSEQVAAKRSEIALSIDDHHPLDIKTSLKAASVATSARAAQPELDLAIIDIENELGRWHTLVIKSGDNLSSLFKQQGLDAGVVHSIVSTPKLGEMLASVRPGEGLEFRINKDGDLTQFRYVQSKLKSIFFAKKDDGYTAELITLHPQTRITYAQADIKNSLFIASQQAGLSDKLTMELAGIFGWDIDFVQDIRSGDRFSLIYEERYLNDEKLNNGNILAATFINQGKSYTAIRYTDTKGDTGYYSPNGESMKKAFLRTPVDFTRISSRFNPNRLHPIFKTKRPHRGVDYAASTNTPIKAAGDGRIKFAGWQSGYGKVVYIQHPNNIVTVYAHQNKIRRGLKKGDTVKQGQIIGYVGKTGWATGPHLHYEFRVNGRHRNPVTVKLPDASPIPKKEIVRFKRHSQTMLAQLETASTTILAQQ